ncbi:MAG: glycogen synthase GlgA [Clostridia bacterium]|nr:glycogen synthase GlgA [Clostridia bacterium]
MTKILFVASECVPFIKTGGLADVVGALPPALMQEGMDVRVFLPKYGEIPEQYKAAMEPVTNFEVELGWRKQYAGVESLTLAGVKYYFVDNQYYFDRGYIYGLGGDEFERFGFFCRAVLNALPLIGFKPDILHCHDWQAGMIPALHKIQYAHIPFYQNMRIIQTIHNLQYQGIFGIKDVQDCLGLGDDLFTTDKLEAYGMANFLKAGLVYADEITTVSPSYAEEITTAFYGERLDGLLRARRGQLVGILNGIDTGEYNPETDPMIHTRYTADTLAVGKAACKKALQHELLLEQKPDTPVIGMVTRLSGQKGLDLIDHVIGQIMDLDVQLVVLGKGDTRYVDLFAWAEGAYPGRVAARFEMNHALAHRIYAGADMFLMPSLFEPCGLSQLISLRYGTLPIARETGGLRDTVLSFNEFTGDGNGFTFFNYNAHDMLETIRRAVHIYHHENDGWKKLMLRGMAADYSWGRSAGDYAALYQKLIKTKTAVKPKTPARTSD